MSAPLLLVVNIGGELLYVLRQRLVAQKIEPVAATTVLSDIIDVLFNEQLLKELLETSQLGRHAHIRQLIEDIASVSIMRLDRFSMNKLWELIVMVFKWQLTNIRKDELFVLTDRHMLGVMDLLPGHPVMSRVEDFRSKMRAISETMPDERVVYMRNSILSWLNDFHTKVSLLLRLGLQRNDGTFVRVTSPDERLSRILRSLGDNIYSYEGTDGEDEKHFSMDASEVSFLSQEFLGEDQKKITKVGSFKHYFLQKPSKGKSEAKASSSTVCKFEMENSKREPFVLHDFEALNESQNSLHDDLLKILSENVDDD